MTADGFRGLLVLALRIVGIGGLAVAGVAVAGTIGLALFGGPNAFAPAADPDAPFALAWVGLVILGGGAAVAAIVASVIIFALAEILEMLRARKGLEA